MREFPASQLERVLCSVLENKHSSFYRERLGTLSQYMPLTQEKWESIPGTPREVITPTPLWERTFVPRHDVHYIRNTYGTSGKRILITPRISYGDYTEPYKSLGVKKMMNFFASAHVNFPEPSYGIVSVFGDVGNLEVSAYIVKKLRVDTLYITPYTALVFAPILAELRVERDIHVIQLCGERCSPLQLEVLRKQYPNATIFSNYSSSETREAVAFPCVHDITAGGSLAVESVPEFYCEILDPQTQKPVTEDGVYGELAVTTLVPNLPFPFVRYLTGDVAAYVKRTCGCDDHTRAFEIIGRMSVFPVRLVKGELTIESVEKALNSLSVASQYFEVHYMEEALEERALPRVSISLVQDERAQDAASLARAIEEHLHVYPTYTYAQGVEAGLYLPLTVSFIDAPQSHSGKGLSPIVVRHIAGGQASTRSGFITEAWV